MTNQIIELPTFYFADAHAGSGKTFSAHKFIAATGGFFTIATQTNELSEQQRLDLLELGVASKVIKLETASDNCTKKYTRHCKELRNEVAIVNQKVALQAIEETRNQNLILDEFASPVEKFTLIEDISATRAFMADLIKAEPYAAAPGFLRIIDTEDTAEIAEFGKARRSSVPQHVVELCKRIHSKHYVVLVPETNYTGFKSGLPDEEGVQIDQDSSKKRLVIYAWMQPSILQHYRSVTWLGANFTSSKLFHYWKDKVNWLPHPSIKGERYDDFANKAPLIDFRHISEDLVSGSMLKTIGYSRFCDSVADAIAREYRNTPHLVTMSANSDGEWKLSTGARVSANPVGLNGFQDRHMAVHLAPLRPSDMDFSIWEAVAGVSRAELMIAQSCEMQYQFFTRTSVRNGKHFSDCKERLTFVGLDLPTIDVLRGIFGVTAPSKPLFVDAFHNYEKPPRKTRSDKKTDEEKRASKTERQRLRRLEKKAQIAAESAAVTQITI